jgi:hypothetical protein
MDSNVKEESVKHEEVYERLTQQRHIEHPLYRSPPRNSWMRTYPFIYSYHQKKFERDSMERKKYSPTSQTQFYPGDLRWSFLEQKQDVTHEEYDDSPVRGYRNVRQHVYDEYSTPPRCSDGREYTLPPLRDYGHIPIRGIALARDYQSEDHRTKYIPSTSSERSYQSIRQDDLYNKKNIRKHEERMVRMEIEPRRQRGHQVDRPYPPENIHGKRWEREGKLYRGMLSRTNKSDMDGVGEMENDHIIRCQSPNDSPRTYHYQRTTSSRELMYQHEHEYPFPDNERFHNDPHNHNPLRHIRERIEADIRSPRDIDNRSAIPCDNSARSGALHNPTNRLTVDRKRPLSESDRSSSVTDVFDITEKLQAPKKKRKGRICKTEGCTKYVVDHGVCIRHGVSLTIIFFFFH